MIRTRLTVSIFAMVMSIGFWGLALARAADTPLPTPKDLKEMYDAKQYRTCLQQIARVMLLKGDVAKPYDKFGLLLLRGECLVQLQDRPTALIAYAAAEKSPDINQAADARAMSVLLSKTVGFLYTPKTGSYPRPISVVDPEGRKAAMAALFQDEFQADKPGFDQSMQGTSLMPMIKSLPKLRDLYALERAATGADKEIHPLLQQMGERARTLIDQELDSLDAKISNTEQNADQVINLGIGGGFWWAGVTRRGLSSMDRDNLRGWIDYTQEIYDASNHGLIIAREFGGTGEKWEPLIGKAYTIRGHAENVLAAE